MKVTITTLFMLALTAALMITLTKKNEDPILEHAPSSVVVIPPQRISRFLAANQPKAEEP
ncbi:hypothetical protein OROMI_025285 [Orobanche minor]